MVAVVEPVEDFGGAQLLPGLQVNKVTAQAAWLQLLEAADLGHPVAPERPISIHDIHQLTGLQFVKLAAGKIIVRQQAGDVVEGRAAELGYLAPFL